KATCGGHEQVISRDLIALLRGKDQTSSFHGFRYSRCRNLRAAIWAQVSAFGSQSMRSLLRRATLPSSAVVVERWPISISLIGFWRVFTQSRKLAQCERFELLLDFSSTACRPESFSG